jgi:AAA+ ATPase superfamily predicted ATPase
MEDTLTKVSRFDRVLSLEFLNAGFRESSLEVSNDVLEYTVSKLDGIAGWLTKFGLQPLKSKPTKQLVEEVFSYAPKTSINEVDHFSKQYLDVVEAIGMGKDRWSDI